MKEILFNLLWKIRVLLYYLCIAILCVIIPPLALIFCRFMKYDLMYKICKYFSTAYILCARFICSVKYEVHGLDKLPKTPSIVLANHQSFWENIFMQMIIPKHTWIIKKEIYNLPILGPAFIKCLDPIAVNRSDPFSIQKIIKKGKEKINEGLWVVMFPEGTRVPVNKNIKLKPSGVKLAMTTKVPIVIIALNSGLVWPPTSFWIKKPGTITVKVVNVIYPEQIENQDVREVNSNITEILNQAKAKLV